MTYTTCYHSPIGQLELKANESHLLSIRFITTTAIESDVKAVQQNAILQQSVKQLEGYFNHRLRQFDLPLYLDTSPFAMQVYQALQRIPYGATTSYKEIASQTSNNKAYRAVGNINHKNPLPIVIPCHRVIGSNGKLVGYGGGLAIKQWLLDHEQKIS